MLKVNKAPCTC